MRKLHIVASTMLIGAVLSASAIAQESNFTTFRVLKPELSMEAAQAALNDCRTRGYQIAVSVTDRFGVLQVTIRDQLAGAHTPNTSFKKAWTAASFRTATSELSSLTETGEAWAIRNVEGALPLQRVVLAVLVPPELNIRELALP